jgi:hypothetical protein
MDSYGAMRLWKKTPEKLRRSTATCFVLALWEIQDVCPIFVIGQKSLKELGLCQFPNQGFHVLQHLVNLKGSNGQQIVAGLPPSPDSVSNDEYYEYEI